MIIKKAVTGELDGKPSIWLEGPGGKIKHIATFVDEESYEDFLNCVEAGLFTSGNKKKVGIEPETGKAFIP
jgi:hypothetical protein